MSHFARRRCDAFTLLETIIAMSLLSLLMLVVWSIFSIYTKLESKGVARSAELTLLRSLHHQMRDDLIQLVPIDPKAAPMLSVASDDPSIAEAPLTSGYFVGGLHDLHFAILEYPTSLSGPTIRIVSYQEARVESEDSKMMDDSQEGSDPSSFSPGMQRRVESWREYSEKQIDVQEIFLGTPLDQIPVLDEDDFMRIGMDDRNEMEADEQAMLQRRRRPPLEDPIPEIRRMRFRYYDGQAWRGDWDSTLSGRLPVAIEVSLEWQEFNADQLNEQLMRETANRNDSIMVGAGPTSGLEDNPDRSEIQGGRMDAPQQRFDQDIESNDGDDRVDRWVIAIEPHQTRVTSFDEVDREVLP